jgi:hypothetical protein
LGDLIRMLVLLYLVGNGEAFHMDSAIVEIFRIAICDGLQKYVQYVQSSTQIILVCFALLHVY